MKSRNSYLKRVSSEIFAFAVVLSLMTAVASGCQHNGSVSTTTLSNAPVATSTNVPAPQSPSPQTSASALPPAATITKIINTKLPATVAPPAPLADYPILGDAYNPPDPGQPAGTFYMDAYELRPNLLFIKAGTWVTWVNVDNKPFFVESVDELFFGITSPLGLSWSYYFDSPGTFAFTISPYNATEIGVIVVTP